MSKINDFFFLWLKKKKCRQIDCFSLSRCYLLIPDRFETKSADFSWENGQHSPQWWGKGNPRQGKQGGEHPGHAGHHWDHSQLAGHHLCLHLHHLVTLIHLQVDHSSSGRHGNHSGKVQLDWWRTGVKSLQTPRGVHPASLQMAETTRTCLDPLFCTGGLIQDTFTLVTRTCARWWTLERLQQTREGLHGVFFQMKLSPLQTAYLPHGYLISFSQRFFVSVHICIGFKGTYSSNGCFYTVFLSVFGEIDGMCCNLIKSILGEICAVNINLL